MTTKADTISVLPIYTALYVNELPLNSALLLNAHCGLW